MASAPEVALKPAHRSPSLPQRGSKMDELGFSPLEWLVVAVSRRDSIASLQKPSRLSMAFGSLFGSKSASSLADSRLEELRYAAVLAWHGRRPNASELQRFAEAGYEPGHRDLLYASVARETGAGTDPRIDGRFSTAPVESLGLH